MATKIARISGSGKVQLNVALKWRASLPRGAKKYHKLYHDCGHHSFSRLGKGTAKEMAKIAGSRFDFRHLPQNIYLLSVFQGKGGLSLKVLTKIVIHLFLVIINGHQYGQWVTYPWNLTMRL